MPTNYAGSDASYPANVALPDDGDNGDAAILDQPSIDLADRSAYMRKWLQPTVRVARFRPTTFTARPGADTTPVIDLSVHPGVYESFMFTGVASKSAGTPYYSMIDPAGLLIGEVWTAASLAHGYNMPLTAEHLSNGRTLSSVKARFVAAAAHGGLPAQMPAVFISRDLRTDFSSAATALLSTTNGWSIDSSANVGVYETAHDITFTPNQNNVIDLASYLYTLTVAYEGGTNALLGGRILGLELTHT